MKATFRRRKTTVPAIVPVALTEEFGRDSTKRIQWNAFVRKGGIAKKVPEFLEVLSLLREFLLPVMDAASSKETLLGRWKAHGPWQKEDTKPGKG